jgi:hypothetical protein
MDQETNIGSTSALAVTFDVAGHEVPTFRLLSEGWGARAEEGSRHQGTEGMFLQAANLGRGFTCRRIVCGRCRMENPTTTEDARALTSYIEA